MSKSKKQRPEDKPVKLDVSFEAALKLAMKTPPIYGMDLLLDQEQELTDIRGKIRYGGRIITFKQMDVYPQTEKIHEFFIEVRSSLHPLKILKPLKLKKKDASTFAALFIPWQSDPSSSPSIKVMDGEEIFLTLRKKEDYIANLELCRVNFTSATKF